MHRTVRIGDADVEIDATAPDGEGASRICIDGDGYDVKLRQAAPHELWLVAQDRSDAGASDPTRQPGEERRSVFVAEGSDGTWVGSAGRARLVRPPERRARRGSAGDDAELPVTPPMPAVVTQVLVELGQEVAKGDPLIVVTAMKMEMTLSAPHAGTVAAIRTTAGAKVNPGEILIDIEPAASAGEPSDGESP